jgi:hypothetical protein
MRVALGMARNTTEADFRIVPQKYAFSIFRVLKSGFFEAATETRNQNLGKILQINNRPPGIRISGLILFW